MTITDEINIISEFVKEQLIINRYYKDKGFVLRDKSNNIIIPYGK